METVKYHFPNFILNFSNMISINRYYNYTCIFIFICSHILNIIFICEQILSIRDAKENQKCNFFLIHLNMT